MPLSRAHLYKDTPAISTQERLPRKSDGTAVGGNVLAREHNSQKWWPTRWSDVTRLKHVEWRKIEIGGIYRKKA